MKYFFITFILYFFVNVAFCQNPLPADSVKHLYKSSNIIFTGVVVSEYANNATLENFQIVEFELTEIQKGKDFSRFMVYATKEKWNIENGKEYIVFAVKKKHTTNYYLSYCEEVCNTCPNYAIKSVYDIVNKTFFATIKKPRSLTSWQNRGCGCH
jgi:hypothetical protein